MKVTQLTLFLENRSGRLAEVAGFLGKAGINIRGFWHAIRVTKGDYDDPNDVGEVSHFQALASALSASLAAVVSCLLLSR